MLQNAPDPPSHPSDGPPEGPTGASCGGTWAFSGQKLRCQVCWEKETGGSSTTVELRKEPDTGAWKQYWIPPFGHRMDTTIIISGQSGSYQWITQQ